MAPSTPTELTRELLIAVHEVMGRSNAQLRTTLDSLRLTAPLAEALWALDPRLPSPSMKTLAARLYCDPSSATFLAGRLERLGLTERVPDPADGRAKTVELTGKGTQVRRALVEAMVQLTPLATLSSAERTTALHLFRKALTRNDAAREAGARPGADALRAAAPTRGADAARAADVKRRADTAGDAETKGDDQ
ncbi:MarR family winged helix-turn-helix transcriptional regulator [Streptomyces sp. NPDC093589]|uniref:MarR family winged helix-turn-helix transcriptional regulator n=1 Tax=Streptomyces sp. NPDC093589 TaxID=3366043 RepID=UPI00380271C2